MTTNNAQKDVNHDNQSNSNTDTHITQDAALNTANHNGKSASQFGKVAVVYGGSSNERSVSLDSGAASIAVATKSRN